jgi:hypothetical protein
VTRDIRGKQRPVINEADNDPPRQTSVNRAGRQGLRAEVFDMNEPAHIAVAEARQSMLRVWMALSAVWIAFWLIVAGIVLTAFEPYNPLIIQLGIFALIVATPPFVLLAIGAVLRWLFETIVLRKKDR